MALLSQFDAFHELAAKTTGLDDFGPTDYVEPMKHLLADYDRYNQFTPSSEQAIGADIVGVLAGRLFAYSGFKAHPDFADAPIEKPLFIVGMARTGTTALQRVLSRDPATQSLPLWLASMPLPRPPRDTWEHHPVFQQVAQGVRQIAPEFQQIHPMQADEPDECRLTLTQSFWAPALISSEGAAPNFADWCLSCDASYAYRYYKRVLGLVAAGDRRRWLLKCPTHVWGLDALLDVFPDANVVFTHRDVRTSMISTGSMTYAWRRMRDPSASLEQVSKEILVNWGRALDKAEKVRRRHDPARFFDVHVSEVQSDLLGTVERIYDHFKLPFTEENRAALTRYTTRDPRAGHGKHQYEVDSFGFGEAEVRAAIGEYDARNRAVDELSKNRR